MGCCFAFLGRSWMRPKLGWLNVFWQRPKTRLVKGDRDRRRRMMMMMMMFFPSENGFCSLETAESPKSLGSFWFFPQVCCYAGWHPKMWQRLWKSQAAKFSTCWEASHLQMHKMSMLRIQWCPLVLKDLKDLNLIKNWAFCQGQDDVHNLAPAGIEAGNSWEVAKLSKCPAFKKGDRMTVPLDFQRRSILQRFWQRRFIREDGLFFPF